jgi:hypothetical protein
MSPFSHNPENEENGLDPDEIMDALSTELSNALKEMSKTTSLDKKETHSRIVKNLSESLGVFLNLASDMIGFDPEETFSVDDDLDPEGNLKM